MSSAGNLVTILKVTVKWDFTVIQVSQYSLGCNCTLLCKIFVLNITSISKVKTFSRVLRYVPQRTAVRELVVKTQTTTSTHQCCKIPGNVRTPWKQEAKQINIIIYKIKKLLFKFWCEVIKTLQQHRLWREQPNISLVVEYVRDEV
jgi:hypothetical protein